MMRRFFSRFARPQSSSKAKQRRRAERRKSAYRALGVTGLGVEWLEDRRMLAAGALDTTFNTTGTVIDNLQLGFDEQINAVATQHVAGEDKILVAGFIKSTSGAQIRDVLVARYNADGSRDTTFGTGGYTVVNASTVPTGSDDGINDILIDEMNRIILVGTARTAIGSTNFTGVLMMRFTEGGLVDTSFDGDGKVITVLQNAGGTNISVGPAADSPRMTSAAYQADGKIVVGATAINSVGFARDFAVLRYNDNGTLDTSFDGDGYTLTNFSGQDDELFDVMVQADGRIVAVGTTRTGGALQDFALARYDTNGALDLTFGVGGKTSTNIAPTAFTSQDFATSVFEEPDGQIVVGGYSDVRITSGTLRQRDMVVARYNSDGSLDDASDSTPLVTFGTGSNSVLGTVRVSFNVTNNDEEQSFAMFAQPQPDGKYVIGGHFAPNSATADKFGVARLLADGSFDPTFDTDGKTEASFAGSVFLVMSDIMLQPDGKIVGAGFQLTTATGGLDVLLARWESGLLIADAGGPYTIDEPGGGVPLTGTGVGAGTLTYEWDLDNDGIFGETGAGALYGDEVGQNPTFTVLGVDGPTVYNVTLRVLADENGDLIIDQIATDTTTVTVVNVAPAIAADNNTVTVNEGSTATNSGTFSDVGPDVVTLTASIGIVIDNDDGTWSWSYGTADGPDDSQMVTITATDDDGDSTDATFQLNVDNVAPTVAADNATVTVNEGDTASNTGSFADVGVDVVTLVASIGTIIDNGDGTWSWSFDTSDGPDDTQIVTITATDSDGESSDTSFQLNVDNVAPSVAADIAAVAANEGDTATNTGTYADFGADVVTIAASVGTIIDNGDGTWSWSFDTNDGPDDSQVVTITATDSDGESSNTTFQLTVDNVAPTVAADNASVTANEGDTATNTGTYADPGVDVVSLVASVGMVIDNGDGTWSWSYGTADGPDDSVLVTVTATDSDGESSSTAFQLNVDNVAPTVAADQATVVVDEGDTATNSGSYADPGVDTVSLVASVGIIIDNSDGTWSWSYGTADGPDDSVLVTITATDSDGESSSTSFQVNVENVAPMVAADNAAVTVDEGDTATNSGTYADPGVDVVSLVASVGIVIDNGDGTWSWSYGTADGPDDSVLVTITATDSDGESSSTSFQLTVDNVAPSVAADGAAVSVDEGSAASNTGTYADPGADTVTLTASAGIIIDNGDGTWSWSAGSTDGPASTTVTITATDSDGVSSTTTFQLNVNNVAPTADAGGPYTVAEGGTVTLSGSGSDPAGAADPLTFAWDLDNNGSFETAGANAAFDATGIDGTASYTVNLQVSDGDGGVTVVSTTVTVINVAPTADAGGPYLAFEDTPIAMSGSGSDPAGAADPLTFTWDLDNDGIFGETGAGATRGNEVGATPTFDPTGLATGPYTVTLRVSDGDGGVTFDTATVNVLTSGTLLIDGTLYIVGTNSCDFVLISQCNDTIYVCASFNDDNPVTFNSADVQHIEVRMRGNTDIVLTTSSVMQSMTIDGGSGNDLLMGGGGDNLLIGGSGHDVLYGAAGNDVLLGGSGNDDLIGGSGDDVLVGGDGDDCLEGGSGRDLMIGSQDNDRIKGGDGEDILIGGYTIHDNNLAALDAIMAVWTSSDSFTARVNTLKGSGGLLESGVTVFDDDDNDQIDGGSGRDLVFGDTYKWDGAVDKIKLQSTQDVLVAVN
jgi:uncharacterized delta-60 repeat protein